MMYNTGNPVGSTAPKDLYDNAQVLDKLVVGTDPMVVDRLGAQRYSWAGMEYDFQNAQAGRDQAFQDFLAASAFVFIGDYAAGLTFTNRSQYMIRDGIAYRLAPSTTLPYTTTGNWGAEAVNFTPISSDDILRQDLASSAPSKGAFLVARASVQIDSVDDLKLFEGRRDGDQVTLLGYYSDTPGVGGGTFRWDASSTETDNGGTIISVTGVPTGRWVRPTKPEPRLSWFGVRGDGSDETAKINAATSTYTGTGSVLVAESNSQLRITGPVSLFDVSLFLNGSTLTAAHVGNKCLLQCKGRAGVNNGTLVQAGTPVGDLGLAGQRIIFGLDVHDCSYSNLKFECGAFGHAPFNLIGDVNNVKVDNVRFGTGPWAMGLIIHWATASDSAALDYAADITYLPSVSNATTHPRNITVNNLRGDTFNGPGTLVTLLYLSGAYGVTASNVVADQIAKIFVAGAGDYGSDFAPEEIKALIGNGIVLNNPTCLKLTGATGGMVVSGQGFFESVPATSRLAMDVTINNPLMSTELTGTRYGLFVDNCSGVKVIGGSITKFSTNAFWQRNVTGGLMDSVRIAQASQVGVLMDSDADKVRGVTLRRCQIYGNNTSGVVLPTLSGIRVSNTNQAKIEDCRFGQPGVGETQQHSVYVVAGCDNISLQGNHTFSSAQTSAYAGDVSGGQFSMRLWDLGNTSDTAFSTSPADHVWSTPSGFGLRKTLINTTSTVPSTGTHKQGDEVIFRTPAASGPRGAICTVAGSPGTWKTYGTLAA